MTIHQKILHWFATGDTGVSSQHMAFVAAGISSKGKHTWPPYDADDLNRCIQLVKAVPEIKDAFPRIAETSESWAITIQHWDELVELFHSEVGEDWSKGQVAPLTNERMREIGL